MQLLIFILVYPLLWVLSLLPFRVLYLFSDILSFLLFNIIGYRKKVVLNNLKLALPNKSTKDLLKIRRQFYSHFTDVFIEMIKSITLSKKSVNKHFVFENTHLINELAEKGKSIVVIGGHYANWEWILTLNDRIKHNAFAIYSPIGNKYFDNMMMKNRSRYGTNLVTPRDARKTYADNKKNGVLSLNGLISDQSPMLERTRYWSDFLNVKVPIHVGAEIIAKDLDQSVLFYKVTKLKRGYYKCSFSVLVENPKEYPDYQITELFLRKLEEQIYEAPQYYFWTHNRFKHKDRFEEYLKLNPKYSF